MRFFPNSSLSWTERASVVSDRDINSLAKSARILALSWLTALVIMSKVLCGIFAFVVISPDGPVSSSTVRRVCLLLTSIWSIVVVGVLRSAGTDVGSFASFLFLAGGPYRAVGVVAVLFLTGRPYGFVGVVAGLLKRGEGGGLGGVKTPGEGSTIAVPIIRLCGVVGMGLGEVVAKGWALGAVVVGSWKGGDAAAAVPAGRYGYFCGSGAAEGLWS